MKDITEGTMAKAIIDFGGLALFHRFCPIEQQIEMFKGSVLAESTAFAKGRYYRAGCSMGVKEIDFENISKIIDNAIGDIVCRVFCLDIAHCDCALSISMIEKVAKTYPDVLLIAGNISTASGARRLYDAGADVIKVGQGSGSLCSTRVETGNGVPQMTALHDVFEESLIPMTIMSWDEEKKKRVSTGVTVRSPLLENRKFKIIADGGIRRAGDIVKALCYSDAVMLGSLLSGTDETPGEVVMDLGMNRRFKQYAGSSTHKTRHVEGIVAHVECKGPVTDVLTKLTEGLRSGLSYQGCCDLEKLKEDPEFIQVTNAGLIESHPHIK
jgi:IMP dehydrogenase